jgi:hypothetical protein
MTADEKPGAEMAQVILPSNIRRWKLARAWESERCHAITSAGNKCRANALSDASRESSIKQIGVDIPPGVCRHHALSIARLRGVTVVWPFQIGKRCKATAKSTGLPCRRMAMLGTPVCRVHGAKCAEHGRKAWRRVRMPDGSIKNVPVRRNPAKVGESGGA